MICKPCADAGRLLEHARSLPFPQSLVFAQGIVKTRHADCIAPANCPCHHVIVLDRSQIIVD